MALKRVVVTGLGALTPIGNNLDNFWTGLIEGKSGAAPITYFNTEKFKTKFACELKNLMFYEIDAPTATGKVWIEWLKAADLQIVIANGLNKPDKHFIELWNYLKQNTPNIDKIIILNRVTEIKGNWANYSDEKILCVGIGETIDEETAIASENDILAVVNYIKERYG